MNDLFKLANTVDQIRRVKRKIKEANKLRCTCNSTAFIIDGCHCGKGKTIDALSIALANLRGQADC